MSSRDHPIMQAIARAFPAAIVTYAKGHALIDPNPAEIAAMDIAGQRGGEYVESLGRTDFATWTQDEWKTFVARICGGYVDSLHDLRAAAAEGIEKVRGS